MWSLSGKRSLCGLLLLQRTGEPTLRLPLRLVAPPTTSVAIPGPAPLILEQQPGYSRPPSVFTFRILSW